MKQISIGSLIKFKSTEVSWNKLKNVENFSLSLSFSSTSYKYLYLHIKIIIINIFSMILKYLKSGYCPYHNCQMQNLTSVWSNKNNTALLQIKK